MRSRDYTKEIGVSSARQQVPKAVAIAILTVVALVGAWFLRGVVNHPPAHGASAEPVAAKVASR